MKREGTRRVDHHVRRDGAQSAGGRGSAGRRGISAEIVDLRTVYPLDEETVLRSIEKTSRALVLYESYRFLGIGAEVAAMIAEKAFEHLDAPVVRLAPPNMPVPFSPPLEDAFLPAGRRHRGGRRPVVPPGEEDAS